LVPRQVLSVMEVSVPRKHKKKKEKKVRREFEEAHARKIISTHLSSPLMIVKFKDVFAFASSNNGLLLALKKDRGLIRQLFGVDEPVVKFKTGLSVLTTTAGGDLTQVVTMDISGMSDWSSWAAIFDEYYVKTAHLVFEPTYDQLTLVQWPAANNSSAAVPFPTNLGNVPSAAYTYAFGVVVDYDDSGALTTTTTMMAYDTLRILHACKRGKSKNAVANLPPDVTWVTTASPTPVWYYKTKALVPNVATFFASLNIGQMYLSGRVAFKAKV
jgi:hypothetical protein